MIDHNEKTGKSELIEFVTRDQREMLVIFAHGIVVTLDPNRRIIEDGAVVTEGDRIIAVDKTEEILARYHSEPAEIIDCQRKLILPGLIDAHAHAGHSMFTMIGESTPSNWMPIMTKLYHHNTTEEFWYLEGRLAALQRLTSGVTCGVSVLTNCQRSDNPTIGINHARGYAEVGVREIVAVGPSNPPFPRRTTHIREDGSKEEALHSFDDLMRGADETIAKVNHTHDDLIRAVIAPFVMVSSVEGSGSTSMDKAVKLTEQDRYMMKCVREVARDRKCRIHTEAFGGNDSNGLSGQSQHASGPGYPCAALYGHQSG